MDEHKVLKGSVAEFHKVALQFCLITRRVLSNRSEPCGPVIRRAKDIGEEAIKRYWDAQSPYRE